MLTVLKNLHPVARKEQYYNIVLKKPNEFVTRYLEKLRKELKELEENDGD